MAMIKYTCPECGHILQIPDEYAGQHGKCKFCEQPFVVPGSPSSPSPVPPSPEAGTGPEYIAPQQVIAKSRPNIRHRWVVGAVIAVLVLFTGLCLFDAVRTRRQLKYTEQMVALLRKEVADSTNSRVPQLPSLPVISQESTPVSPPFMHSATDDPPEAGGPFDSSTIYNLNDIVLLSDSTLRVFSANAWQDTNMFASVPRSGHVFVALDVSLFNRDVDVGITVASRSFSIRDKDGRKFDSSFHSPEPRFPGGTVAKGERVRGWITFEVPVNIERPTLYYEVNTFKGHYVRVKLWQD